MTDSRQHTQGRLTTDGGNARLPHPLVRAVAQAMELTVNSAIGVVKPEHYFTPVRVETRLVACLSVRAYLERICL